ncbi:protein of unknown function [Acidiphilium rubrum]|uniref:DUF4345 domain-containing protein n=2 Tax=Acidocellaceae TaxID=3385905 RepID=A0A8G2CKF5_ACIRU|nr:protein of unknown function [Acidiphilium rubrum]
MAMVPHACFAPAKAYLGAMTSELTRRNLQIAIAVAGIVPVGAGLGGILLGTNFAGDPQSLPDLTSMYVYLSGLLLAIGLVFYASIPHIERHTGRVRLLTLIVAIGGLARLAGIFLHGIPGPSMFFGLVMELIVTPFLCWWQSRIAVSG